VARLQGPWPARPAVNDADPFTLVAMHELDASQVFSYMNAEGQVYAFSAPDLARYFDAAGALNPLTRQRVPPADEVRLRALVRRQPKDATACEVVWRTPRDAFADVLHDYERLGFYSLIDWFTTLNVEGVYDIFEEMHRMRHWPASGSAAHALFALARLDEAIISSPNDTLFALARAMQALVGHVFPSQFYALCTLFSAVARANRAVQVQLPEWLVAGAL
jgi:hypothetical protein